jgi:hypothetical protein
MPRCLGRQLCHLGLLSQPCQVQLCVTFVLGLDVSVPKSHLLVDSLPWLAYAVYHMFHIGIQNAIRIHYYCCKLCKDILGIYSTMFY